MLGMSRISFIATAVPSGRGTWVPIDITTSQQSGTQLMKSTAQTISSGRQTHLPINLSHPLGSWTVGHATQEAWGMGDESSDLENLQ